MLELLCFAVDMLLLILTVLILNTIPKPPPPYVGVWKLKNENPPNEPYEKAVWQLYEPTFEWTQEGTYYIKTQVYKEDCNYKVMGGGDYLIINFVENAQYKKNLGVISYENRIMIGGVRNFLIFKILKTWQETTPTNNPPFFMQLQQIPFSNASRKLPHISHIKKQERTYREEKIEMPQLTLKRIKLDYEPLFPYKFWEKKKG
ncbi:MAG: hypothetical protein R3E32_13445 [Chitinophagales bacterium]